VAIKTLSMKLRLWRFVKDDILNPRETETWNRAALKFEMDFGPKMKRMVGRAERVGQGKRTLSSKGLV
jgi:hypothetical protein